MSAQAKIIPLSSKRDRAPATHAYCNYCDRVQPISAHPAETGPAMDVLYEAAHVKCDRCHFTIAELFRRRGTFE